MRTLRRLIASAALAAPLVLSGCNDPGPPPSLTGIWSGSAGGRTITLNLTDDAGDLSGSGTITNPSAVLFVSGTKDGYQVQLAIVANAGGVFNNFSIAATIEDGDIVGTASGWNFGAGAAITLNH